MSLPLSTHSLWPTLLRPTEGVVLGYMTKSAGSLYSTVLYSPREFFLPASRKPVRPKGLSSLAITAVIPQGVWNVVPLALRFGSALVTPSPLTQPAVVLHRDYTRIVARLTFLGHQVCVLSGHAPHRGHTFQERSSWWRETTRICSEGWI